MPSPSPPPAPPVLPISEHEDEIVAAVDANPVVVVIGETGSGKSTQLSQILHRRGYTRRGAIAVTQPRRVAAVSVSRFPHQYLLALSPVHEGIFFCYSRGRALLQLAEYCFSFLAHVYALGSTLCVAFSLSCCQFAIRRVFEWGLELLSHLERRLPVRLEGFASD